MGNTFGSHTCKNARKTEILQQDRRIFQSGQRTSPMSSASQRTIASRSTLLSAGEGISESYKVLLVGDTDYDGREYHSSPEYFTKYKREW